jgi:hypothetical protein
VRFSGRVLKREFRLRSEQEACRREQQQQSPH